jgi:hypothetical protein
MDKGNSGCNGTESGVEEDRGWREMNSEWEDNSDINKQIHAYEKHTLMQIQ